ncbi:hypothetical protein GCM10010315_57450 [Streptomyces luteosporeus]|uniref:Uncharacterized protein n=1 Tax=Streptomyces luteosporeus TaxID=173856 RepID=A0ABN3U6W6_9ACTN
MGTRPTRWAITATAPTFGTKAARDLKTARDLLACAGTPGSRPPGCRAALRRTWTIRATWATCSTGWSRRPARDAPACRPALIDIVRPQRTATTMEGRTEA